MAADTSPLTLDLPAEAGSVARARSAVLDFMDGRGCFDREALALIVSEAVSNAVLHAYPDASRTGRVRLRAKLHNRLLHLEVADDGIGPQRRSANSGLGMGLCLIEALADEVVVDVCRGTRVSVWLSSLECDGAPRRRHGGTDASLSSTAAPVGV